MAISEQRLTDLESGSWEQRIGRGTDTEEHLKQTVQTLGKRIVGIVHEKHFPDLLMPDDNILVQVADGRRSGPHPNVIKEEPSLDACVAEEQRGNRVLCVWRMSDDTYWGNVPSKLSIAGSISEESRGHGSGTPAYKIRKSSLVPLGELFTHSPHS